MAKKPTGPDVTPVDINSQSYRDQQDQKGIDNTDTDI